MLMRSLISVCGPEFPLAQQIRFPCWLIHPKSKLTIPNRGATPPRDFFFVLPFPFAFEKHDRGSRLRFVRQQVYVTSGFTARR